MAAAHPISPDTRRFSVRLPRPLWFAFPPKRHRRYHSGMDDFRKQHPRVWSWQVRDPPHVEQVSDLLVSCR